MSYTYLRNGPGQVNGVSGTAIILTWVTVIARCYVRAGMIKMFGLEDWLAVASLLCFTAYAGFTFEGAAHGMGMKVIDLSLEDAIRGLRSWWFCTILYIVTSCFLKASVAIQLLNLTDRKMFRNAIWVVLGISVAYTVAFFFFLLFQCWPINHLWAVVQGQPGSCIATTTFGNLTYVHSAFNLFADFFFAALPWLLVKNLHLPPKTKFTVAAILALGGLASCVVIIRIPYIYILEKNVDELLYYCTWVINCTTAENGLGISAAALATLRPLFRSFLSASRQSFKSSNRSSSNCLKISDGNTPKSAPKSNNRPGIQANGQRLTAPISKFNQWEQQPEDLEMGKGRAFSLSSFGSVENKNINTDTNGTLWVIEEITREEEEGHGGMGTWLDMNSIESDGRSNRFISEDASAGNDTDTETIMPIQKL